jgi:hypothetical protein
LIVVLRHLTCSKCCVVILLIYFAQLRVGVVSEIEQLSTEVQASTR